ncbi:MAG: SDR family NAD(P)-dependent oxidoreductase [Xanthomonadales bacterium]|nr:SDR family NAD(P)-dependent oxidoreductase [Xanthomonadales bacterium]
MRLALVSGGSRGLGAALCAHWRGQGWRAIDCSRSGAGPDHLAVDLADPQAAEQVLVPALAALARQPWQEVVVVANAARLEPVGPLARLDTAELLRHFAVNLTGTLVFLKTALAAFAGHGAERCLLAISSGAARRPIRGWAPYCAGKAALEQFMAVLALEQDDEERPVRTLTVSPGVLDTGMQQRIRASDPAEFPDRDQFVAFQDSGALRDPAVVAAAIADWLANRPDNGSRFDASELLLPR